MIQSEPESNGNDGVLCIPQSRKIRVSSSDDLMSYPWDSLGEVRVLHLFRDAVGVFCCSSRLDFGELCKENL